MEAQATATSVLISLICIIIVTGVAKVVNWIWLTPKNMERRLKQQGLHGNSYRFLLGDIKEFISMHTLATKTPMACFSNDYIPRIEPFRYHLSINYGRDYFIWLGPIPMVNISKPEAIREILAKSNEFQKAKLHPIIDKLFRGIVSYKGEKWAKHRKMINPAFHIEKLKLMLPAFWDSCIDMISKWENIIAETGSSELDVWPYLTTLSADVISRAAFGSSYEEGQRIFVLLKEQIHLALNMLQSVYIPGSSHIPTEKNRRFKAIDNQIHILLKNIIDKRKEAIKAEQLTKPDLLGILMDSSLKEIHQDHTSNNKNQMIRMTLQEVIDECKLFYLAGQETTSILLVWTLILLSKHQDWQARAREEVLQTFGKNAPDFEGLNHLKTVTMILYEVLRLYPPATQLSRGIYKDIKLGELSLPAGVMVNFQIVSVHRDKEIWGEEAEEFKPERFSDGISKATGGVASFFPFGGGPRTCMGEKFAMTEVKMALSMILQRFSFKPSPSYSHAPTTVFFLQPQHGAQIILQRL